MNIVWIIIVKLFFVNVCRLYDGIFFELVEMYYDIIIEFEICVIMLKNILVNSVFLIRIKLNVIKNGLLVIMF